MRWIIAPLAAFALLAGCDRAPLPKVESSSPRPSTTTTTPANVGAASQQEKKDGSNPVQGQVDPKAMEQQRDFKQKGDGAGPRPGS
jgi:hypothetical protein